MSTSLLKSLFLAVILSACATASRNSRQADTNDEVDIENSIQPIIGADQKPQSLMNLPQSQDGGFVLAPGFYEAEFKTYCLQPGTPDPSQGDAYLQGPVTGHRKDIIESVLINSRNRPEVDQRNVQLLLWSIVSGSNFNKLSSSVQSDAMKLLTPKQVFTLKGGVVGVIKTVSQTTGVFNAHSDVQRLFENGVSSYEKFEQLAVLREKSQIREKGVKYDQWYKQEENYYVRYFPESYKKVKIQLYVPDSLMDAERKVNGEHVVFDPTGLQAIPAFTNAQRLGIGAPVLDVIRVIIQVNKKTNYPRKTPEKNPQKKITKDPPVGK